MILQPGDHTFITKKSVVYYGDARFISLDLVETLIASKTNKFVCEQNYCCTRALMARLKEGLLNSRFTPNGIKEYCRAIW